MKKYHDVAPRLENLFHGTEKSKIVIEYFGQKHTLFWDYLNLTFYLAEHIDFKKTLGPSGLILASKFMNHSASAYKMLTEWMVDEFYILYRQSCEVKWLLQYFVQFPDAEEDWLSAKKNFISPREVRKKLDYDEQMKSLYDFLSENVHPKTQSISNVLQGEIFVGGIRDEFFSNTALFIMMCSIEENIYTLYDIIKKQNNVDLDSFLLHKPNADQLTPTEELIILSTGQFSILSERFNLLFKANFEL